MPTEKQIRDNLEEVLVPGAMRSLSKLNLVRNITISNERVSITLGSAALNQGAQDWLKAKVSDTIGKLPRVKETEINFVEAIAKDLNEIQLYHRCDEWQGGSG